MQLFLDRNKTLLPRIDVIYMLARVMTLLGIGWFALFGDYPPADRIVFYVVLGTFAVHLAVYGIAIMGRFDLKLAYLSAIIYDLILVPTLVLHAGGMPSPFFLLYYLTISVAVYVLTFPFALTTAALVVATYIISVFTQIDLDSMFNLSMQTAFVLVYFLAISYASDYMRRSEKRLMKLFDTLNMRTAELEKSQAQLEMIYENSRSLASILDSDGLIKEIMRMLGTILQYPQFAVILKDDRGKLYVRASSFDGHKNLHARPLEMENAELIQRVSTVGEPIRVKDITTRDDYGALVETSHSAMLVPMLSRGRVKGVLVAEATSTDFFRERDLQLLTTVARSAALALENAQLHRRTEEMTIIDELTETYNYRYFVQKLQEEKRRAVRYQLPLSLIMVDIDWFKKLNDSYGHEIGNMVLAGLSKIIKGCIRDVDIFARYGGEEFVVILPQTTVKEARIIAERIREHVERAVFDAGKYGKIRITVSVGVSSFPENGHSHEELVSVTDEALYQAKGEGRNLVCTR